MAFYPRSETDRRDRRGHVTLAREPAGGYAAGRREAHHAHTTRSGRTSGGSPSSDATAPPLGLPMLAEVPELADPLVAFARAEQALVAGVLALTQLLERDDDLAVDTTGVGVEHWLALTNGSPKLERRGWLRTAGLLRRLPQLRAQVADGRVSAGQLRALTIALKGAPTAIDAELDGWLAQAAAELHELDADPDVLVRQAGQAMAELTDQIEQLEDQANRERFLSLQPRLDGSGGTFTGSEDAYGFAILEAATRPRPGQPLADAGRARADNLQTALHGLPACDQAHSDHRPDGGVGRAGDDDGGGDAAADDAGLPVPVAAGWAAARAADATWDAAHLQATETAPDLAERIAGYAAAGGYAPPKLLLRTELSSLVDGSIPTDILTGLAGGKLRVTSAAARTLIDHHGVDLRLIITDHGETVGVGRTSRKRTGWLLDATLAIHDTCTEPLCDRPALGADTDHATPWYPQGDQRVGGRTDLDELGPLCLDTNRDRPATGWEPHQHDSGGIRTWHHPRAGLTVTSVPATWRPTHRRPPPPRAGPDRDDAGENRDRAGPNDLPF